MPQLMRASKAQLREKAIFLLPGTPGCGICLAICQAGDCGLFIYVPLRIVARMMTTSHIPFVAPLQALVALALRLLLIRL
ncbi:MAG: hypothetical protein N4A61_02590 [Pelagimonas sp.]|jgi:hypothetical protein|nr:hypothetical protein [Pelagimonas sp.]